MVQPEDLRTKRSRLRRERDVALRGGAYSEHGGTLLIGVGDGGEMVGLEPDYASLRKEGNGDRDLLILHLNQILENAVGLAASANVTTTIHEVDGKFPTEEKFFIHRYNATRAIDDDVRELYITKRSGRVQ